MNPKEKVIFVDFRKRRKPSLSGFEGGSKMPTGLFLGFLAVEVLGAAAFLPSAIGSAFFAPTVIALAVALTMGIGRLRSGFQSARFKRRRGLESMREDRGPGHTGRTLH